MNRTPSVPGKLVTYRRFDVQGVEGYALDSQYTPKEQKFWEEGYERQLKMGKEAESRTNRSRKRADPLCLPIHYMKRVLSIVQLSENMRASNFPSSGSGPSDAKMLSEYNSDRLACTSSVKENFGVLVATV